jgi:hypothetical protein
MKATLTAAERPRFDAAFLFGAEFFRATPTSENVECGAVHENEKLNLS